MFAVLPLLVPTINGYKRLVGGEAFWAPNAVTYGYDSRAASVRVISPPSVPAYATRFEVRVPGADMNPFFALAAIFAPLFFPFYLFVKEGKMGAEQEAHEQRYNAQHGADHVGTAVRWAPSRLPNVRSNDVAQLRKCVNEGKCDSSLRRRSSNCIARPSQEGDETGIHLCH